MGFQSSLFSGVNSKLNFEPEEFHSDSFSVDEFIQRKRQTVPLDVLRDDLGSHLKCLRSSLIELINQDYGQFVNLSSNLVGLDGRIQSIVGPLTRTKNDLQGFDQLLDTNISSLLSEVEKRRGLRDGKAQLQYLRLATTALNSSSKLIDKVPMEIISPLDFSLLRSTCDEVSETKFLLQCCIKSLLQEQLQLKWNVICNSVLSRLNSLLKIYVNVTCPAQPESEQLSSEAVTIMKSLLYMYTELQCEPVVEEVLVKEVLVPKFEVVLSKKGNIGAIFDAAETFLRESPLFLVWKNLTEFPWMANFDFIGRGIFPCVFGIICKHFPHIWSPSNPELFHSNWSRCDKFINELEYNMPSVEHLQRFRNSDIVKEFNSKWQFPVYFQLRFHSIATELESALEDVSAPCSTEEFKLESTRVMIKALNQCWSKDKNYIARISGRFLKASALIVCRYINEIQVKIASNISASLHISIIAYCDLNLAELVVRQTLSEKMIEELNLGLPDSKDSTELGDSLCNSATDFLSGFSWDETRGAIENNLVTICVSQSSTNIAAVNEVPRLYRRTNRESPTKQLDYVESVLLPIVSLKNDVYNAHQQGLWDKICLKIGSQILERYKLQVQEVLVSVQRMEESLRRLKKVKEKNQPSAIENKGTTDDDKIRLQIRLDVNYFVQKLKEISPTLDTSEIQNLFSNSNGKT